MMEIEIIGEERLDRLVAMFAQMGGNPFTAARSNWSVWKSFPDSWSRWGQRPGMEYVAWEISDLAPSVRDVKFWLSGGSRDRKGVCRDTDLEHAVKAFRAGKAWYPRSFGYGLGAGNPVSDFWTDGKTFFHVERYGSYSYRSVPVAIRRERGL